MCLDFHKDFTIYLDTSAIQLGSIMSQEGKLLAFCSRKLSYAQVPCTTTKRELLSIAEIAKEYQATLLDHKIMGCTDHLDLLCDNAVSLERV